MAVRFGVTPDLEAARTLFVAASDGARIERRGYVRQIEPPAMKDLHRPIHEARLCKTAVVLGRQRRDAQSVQIQ